MDTKQLGVLGQWISLLLSLVGLCVMLFKTGRTGDDIATSGAIVLTIATKIRYYGPDVLAWLRRRMLVRRNKPQIKSEEKAQ